MLWLCLVAAWMITRAWDQSKAQAGSEARRARDWAAGEFERRMADGASGTPNDWWWWAANGRKAWRAMKGARAGASSRSALPNSTPWRRMRSAAWEGAKRGASEGSYRHRMRKHERRRANAAAGGSRSQRGRRNAWRQARRAGEGAAGAAGFAWGWAGWQSREALGVCDRCQATCTRQALEPHVREGGRTWLLCRDCAAKLVPQPPAEPAGKQLDAPADTAGGGPDALDPSGPGPGSADPAPASPHARPAAVDQPGSRPGETLAALSSQETVPRAGADPAPAASSPIALPGGTTAGPAAPEITEGTDMAGELAVRDGNRPAVRAGDAHTYGAQRRGHQTDAQLLDELAYYVGEMQNNLTAANAGRTQIGNVQGWARRMEAEGILQREASAEVDRHLGGVAEAHDRHPGEGANSSYYAGMGA